MRSLDEEELDALDRLGLDRRTVSDRRRGYHDAVPRVPVSSVMEGGWLAFEGAGERRRLAPIPSQWFDAAEQELAELVGRARIVTSGPEGVLE